MVFVVIAALSVALASFALGVWEPQSYQLDNEVDDRGNSFTGLYNPLTDEFSGPVKLVHASGAIFEGELDGRRFSGVGVFEGKGTNAEGEAFTWRFEGTFKEGRMEGEGSYIDYLGSYKGEFANSLPDGVGIYTSINGWHYEGEFLAGKITGKGTVTLADGSTSSGVFEDGLQISTD